MADNVLTIIIPVRNQAKTLSVLLDRLQSLAPPRGWTTEIIAGYTASKDDTLEVLTGKGVKVVVSDEIGPGPARNFAARHARGSLLYFIDADACPVGDDFLIRLVGYARRLKRFGAFGGPILLDPGQRWNPIAVADHLVCWFNWGADRPSGRSALFQPTVSLVMARAVFEAIGGFDPGLRVLEDYELHQRLARRGLPTYYVQPFAVTHRARDTLPRSWRHGWYWGGPFREVFLTNYRGGKLPYAIGSKLFWLNLPRLYLIRMRLVLASAWRVSKWQTCFCFPFMAALILAWSLAVIFGEGHHPPQEPAPV